MPKNETPLSPTCTILVSLFDQACQKWGWESDQGYDTKKVNFTERRYRESKKLLETYILHLENQVSEKNSHSN